MHCFLLGEISRKITSTGNGKFSTGNVKKWEIELGQTSTEPFLHFHMAFFVFFFELGGKQSTLCLSISTFGLRCIHDGLHITNSSRPFLNYCSRLTIRNKIHLRLAFSNMLLPVFKQNQMEGSLPF